MSVEFDDTLPSAGAVSHAERAAPTRIDHFKILRKLGEGGMGVVYAGYDIDLDRKVAIKLLRSVDELSTQRLRREAQALAKFSHPNITRVYEVGTWEGQLYIVMEYVEGQTLSRWCAAAERSSEEILQVLAQAGEGLLAAHRAGLVHRDFKPDNMMVGADGRVRVLDFGLAGADERVEEDLATVEARIAELASTSPLQTPLTQTGTLLGTPAYMSPEQFRGRQVTAASDQFSFCVTLYEALYGARPFGGTRLRELSLNVISGKFEAPPEREGVSARLREALVQGLAPEPEERHADLAVLLEQMSSRGPQRFKVRSVRAVGWLSALAYLMFVWPVSQWFMIMAGIRTPEDSALLVHGNAIGTYLVEFFVLAWFVSWWRSRTLRGLTSVFVLGWALSLPGLFLASTLTEKTFGFGEGLISVLNMGVVLATFYLALPVVMHAGNKLAIVGWSLLATTGLPYLTAFALLEIGVEPMLVVPPALFCLIASSIAPAYLLTPVPAPSPGRKVVLLGLVLLALGYALSSYSFGSDLQGRTLAHGQGDPHASESCTCSSCSSARFSAGAADWQDWRLDAGAGFSRVRIEAVGLEHDPSLASVRPSANGQLVSARRHLRLGESYLLAPDASQLTVRRGTRSSPRDYCISTQLQPLPRHAALTPQRPEQLLSPSWEVDGGTVHIASAGTAPPGSEVVIEVFDVSQQLNLESEIGEPLVRVSVEVDPVSGAWSYASSLPAPTSQLVKIPTITRIVRASLRHAR